jgi:S-DNA-T family DNA segregation ATPase FtsK/SpoIIIE
MPKKATPVGKGKPEQVRITRGLKFASAILFAAGVLFALMIFVKGSSGWTFLHNAVWGVFGFAAVFVPVICIYAAIILPIQVSKKTFRIVCSVALLLLLGAFAQIFFSGEPEGETLWQQIAALYTNGIRGGGFLSVLTALPLIKLLGMAGARIVISVLTLVFIMLVFNLGAPELLKIVSAPFKALGRFFNESAPTEHEDENREQREKREKRERVPKVRGVVPPEEEIGGENLLYANQTEHQAAEEMTARQEPQAEDEDVDNDSDECPFDLDPETAGDEITKADKPKKGNGGSEPGIGELINRALTDNAKKPRALNDDGTINPDSEEYKYPPLGLLKPGVSRSADAETTLELQEKAALLIDTLASFGVQTRIVGIYRGPTVTRFEIQPSAGVKVSRITSLSDDIALNLAAEGVRIEAPIPGKSAVGIEIPNKIKDLVTLREILESKEFKTAESKLTFAVGKDIAGNIILGDVAKMPHVIIAGTTGSGKSVCTNSIIMSILYNASPDEVRLVLIDPKIVEFKVYDGIPHLLVPVVTDPQKAAGALNWAVTEMLRRYDVFASNRVKDITGYNELVDEKGAQLGLERMPKIIIAIDELADLMMAAAKEVEESVCRLAQMARASGMHLIIATQRPSADVLTGLIKTNIPSRIALSVKDSTNSRIILGIIGAEKLLGHGDMLYLPAGLAKPVRVQGCFCSTKEIEEVVEYIGTGSGPDYNDNIMEEIESATPLTDAEKKDIDSFSGSDDEYVEKALDLIMEAQQASTSMLQRRLKLGFARAGRIMDQLEEMGAVGESEGAKPRKILITKQQWMERKARR